MNAAETICVDSNLLVRLVADPDATSIRRQWREWRGAGVDLIAPVLFVYELTNALYRYSYAGQLSPEAVRAALAFALSEPVRLVHDAALHDEAMEIAARHNRPAAYDAHYLALAQRLGVEFWTADGRLYNAVRHQLPWVVLAAP